MDFDAHLQFVIDALAERADELGPPRPGSGRPELTRSARAVCEHVFVRWESQQVERDRERRLPRLGDDAVVRTFDAPEALDIRFHEVRAKSALNAVPKQSRMPFRWTVNPYRGCSHACSTASWRHTRS